MKIIVGSDHVGYPLKEALIQILDEFGIVIHDAGPSSPDAAVDYPDFAEMVCDALTSGDFDQGVLICGTGLGMSMAANKHPGVRAALCHDEFTARQARAHNDANVLCLGAWVITPERARGIVEAWLDTRFEGGRHTPRVAKLNQPVRRRPEDGRRAVAVDDFTFGVALSPSDTVFGSLLFMGQLEEGMAAAREAGLEAVELSLRDPQSVSRNRLEALLGAYGLRLSAIATGQSCLHDALCFGNPDPQVRHETIARFKTMIDVAQPFGAALIIGGIRGRLTDAGDGLDTARVRALDSLRECAHYAGERGVNLLIEPINRYETNFVNTAADGIAAIEAIGLPNVKLLLDTYHMNIEERDLSSALRLAGGRLGYMHLADSNRHVPGQGHVDFAAVLHTLNEIDFRGFVVAEILPLPDDRTAMSLFGQFVASLKMKSVAEA